MSSLFGRWAESGLGAAIASAVAAGDLRTDFRAAICRFEDELFALYPAGHARISLGEAREMVDEIFAVLALRPPRLELVRRFADPRIGGFADVAGHRIAIERGHLYRFLVLHEATHLLVPEDRLHGPAFTFVAQLLYRSFIGIPEEAVRLCLTRNGLPVLTDPTPRLAA
ncbi:MAG TPA: hypothetical protein VLV50_11000 [Stellaceae bacterium]|nr:hypothetical protein [Stellaceae bacterium]